MGVEKYILTSTARFTHREIYFFTCYLCGNNRLTRRFITPKGDVLLTNTRNRKAARREFEELQSQIQSAIQNFGSWRNARGYRYFKGYKTKKGETGGIYSLCTDNKEANYTSKLLEDDNV